MMRRTARWNVPLLLGIVALGNGIVAYDASVIMLAAVALGVSSYGVLARRVDPSFNVEREVSNHTPRPGEEVTVAVSVENVGDRNIPFFRIRDAVPPPLDVVSGSTEAVTALRPGTAVRLEYTIEARRGKHELGPAKLVSRNVSGGWEAETTTSGGECVMCRTSIGNLFLRGTPTQSGGASPTDSGGAGIEFFATREYRQGDPLGRIDWNRYARTRELATVQFRERSRSYVVLLVDNRPIARSAPRERGIPALDLSLAAAEETMTTLLDNDIRVAVQLLDTLPTETTEMSTLAETEESIEYVLRSATREGSEAADATHPYPEAIGERIPDDAKVILFSPLLDDAIVDLATHLGASQHDIAVLSPNVTHSETIGSTVEKTDRRVRIARLRKTGVVVADWEHDVPVTELLGQVIDPIAVRA